MAVQLFELPFFCLGTSDACRGVTTTLSSEKKTYKTGETIPLSFSVINNGEAAFTFCPWQSPLERGRFTAGFFKVLHKGRTIEYGGMMVKRLGPAKADYVTLKKGETLTETVALEEGYNLTERGVYEINFYGRLINGLPPSNTITVILE